MTPSYLRFASLLLGSALSLLATSDGAPIGHAGVPSTLEVDENGRTCTACHNTFPVNPPGGSVHIQAFHYQPGQKQTIRVTVSHPAALRWGFQLTARRASNFGRNAGSFTPANVRVRCSDSPNGRDITPDRPCPSDAVEFAGHHRDITSGGQNGTKTFDVEWNAPESDIGDVVFFAAGNASNSSATNQGDRIYTDALTIEARNRPCPNTALPTLHSVTNAASGSRDISMNSLITIWGRDFAVSGIRRAAYRADLGNGYPRELGCVAVEIGGSGPQYRVPLTYVGHDQINAQLPTSSGIGSLPVRVIVNPDRPNEMRTLVGTMNTSGYSPAFFTFNGRSIAAVHNSDGAYAADPAVVRNGRRARAGDVLQLYATGLGPTDPVWQAGETPSGLAPVRDRLTITIDGTTLPDSDVLYAGLVPGMISGLYQLNVRVPQVMREGDLPVTITVGGVSSPAGTIIPVSR